MAFESALLPNEFIIHDTTPGHLEAPPQGMSKGLELGRRTTGFGAIPNAPAFPTDLIIPKNEWQDRIKEMEDTQTRISDLSIAAGLPCKDQNGTNYCWANAPTHCVEILRVVQNEQMVILSPASVAAPLTKFQNVGGWGQSALEYIVANGVCPVAYWPANAIQRSYYTDTNKTAAQDYKVTEWWELVPRNIDQLVSCLLRRIPVAIGLNWWSHEVTACDAVWLNGAIAIRIRNSWGMSWGSQGFSVLQGSKMLPDDAVAPRVAIAA